MKLEINLKKIEELSRLNMGENISFGSYLKGQDSEKIDKMVHRLNDKISSQIDCVECGNCCNNLRPVATEKVLSVFVEPENIEAFKYLKSFPCKNLCEKAGKACTIYLDRPEECKEYPYMHRDKFITRTHEILQNYEICPIVFNVFEQLKRELVWVKK